MREFDSLGDFAVHLAGRVAVLDVTLNRGLAQVAKLIEKDAKGRIGRYQTAVGPHPGWPELADVTKTQRVEMGFTENDPLLRTGELRNYITHDVGHLEAAIGVKHGHIHSDYDGGFGPDTGDLAVWHEFGTSKMPARPFLGPAGYARRDDIQRLVGAAAMAAITSGGFSGAQGQFNVHGGLGYNFSVRDYGL